MKALIVYAALVAVAIAAIYSADFESVGTAYAVNTAQLEAIK